MHDCPQPGKWAIAVWDGDDGSDPEEAFATCGEGAVVAAYHIDPQDQNWLRWFADRPEISNLETLNHTQGVFALGSPEPSATPMPSPTPSPTPTPGGG